MRTLCLACLALLAPATSDAAPARPRPAARPPVVTASALSPARFPVQRHVLPNGLVVLLHEDHSVPAVSFYQWFKVGSRNEVPGITGISHFFEHMMFNGSRNVPPKEYDRIIESNGGTANGFTDRDMTVYYEEIASDRLEVLLRLDSDRMRELLLDPEVLKSEIEVVHEERRLSIDNDIGGLLDERLYATAFETSPYRWPVLGTTEDLRRLDRSAMVEYFRAHYSPDNCILVLVGDFASAPALALIRKYFGDIPSRKTAPAPIAAEPEQQGERRAQVRHPAQTVSVQIGYKAPRAASPDVWVLDLLGSILSEGESSRLHQALVYEQQIALEVGTFFRTRLDPSLFEFSLEMRPGKTASEGEAALDRVLARLIEEGPTPRELDKAKNLLEAGLVRSLKTNYGVGEQLAFFEHVHGDYRRLFDATGRYRAVTVEDCRRVAREVFVPARRTVAELVLVEEGRP